MDKQKTPRGTLSQSKRRKKGEQRLKPAFSKKLYDEETTRKHDTSYTGLRKSCET